MTDDLVARLRSPEVFIDTGGMFSPVAHQAADEIERLRATLSNSSAVIVSIYQHLERVEAAGGATSLSGMAACNTMLKSMRKNASRIEELVMKPARAALAGEKKDD